MKKFMALFLAVCTCLFIGIMFTACDEGSDHEHTYGEWSEVKAATCSEKGKREKVCSCGETITEDIEVLAHTEETVAGKAATCTEAGYTESKKCSVCQTVIVAPETINATGHNEEVVVGKAATCTESGLSEGKKCTVCDTVTVEQSVIPAAHTEETIPGKVATCTENGLTDGKKCSVCQTVTVEQTVIPASHTEEIVLGKAATCTEAGLTDGKKCSVCQTVIVAQTEIGAKGHTEETVPGKAATCTEAGLTDGKKCSVCGTVTVAQTEIGAKGHTEETVIGKAATCTEKGLTDGKKCSVCGTVTVAQTEIGAKGHTEETVLGKAATCTEAGLTDGKKCSICQTVTVAQQEIGAMGHSYSDTLINDAEYHWYPSICGHADEVKDKGTHTFENGECTVCGRKQLSNTVDENEWANLFTGTNLTVALQSGYMSQNIKFDGNKQYNYMEYGGEGFDLYHEFVTDEEGNVVWYQYEEGSFEGDWDKEIDENGNGGRMRAILDQYFYPLADKYNAFNYDAENKQYTAESITWTIDGTDYVITNVCVKIENGKLLEVTYTSSSMNFVINDIGTTVVTLPTISYTATADEWESIMTNGALYNVRVEILSFDENGDCVDSYGLTFCESAFELRNGYVVKQGDVWYYVSRDVDKGGYIGVVCSKDDYSLKGTLCSQLVGQYDAFTYDEENHCYVATNFAFGDDDSCEEVKVYIRNGRIVMIEQKTTETVNGSKTVVLNTYEFNGYGRVTEDEATRNLPEYTIE